MKILKKNVVQDGLAYHDLSIPNTHTYVLANGIVVHNCGTGAGFSVERRFVDKLPVVNAPTGLTVHHVVEDSTEGWANALRYGLEHWFAGDVVTFDYSLLRLRGAPLKTKGGRASGPEPLKRLLDMCATIVGGATGRRLRPIECHDIACAIGDIVHVGGFRRAALISFSDPDDDEMRHAKDWSRGDFPAVRYMANNSAYYPERPSEEDFWKEWRALIASRSGERGFFRMPPAKRETRRGDFRCNPCVTGDTVVLTTFGPRQVRDLVGSPFEALLDGVAYPSSVSGFWSNGVKPVLRLTVLGGAHLDLTADHLVCCISPSGEFSWVAASALKPGHRVRLNRVAASPVPPGVVVSVEPIGEAEVFDCSIDEVHAFGANGFYVHNCGEISLRFTESDDPHTGHGGSGSFCVAGDTQLITREGVIRIQDAVGRSVDVWNGKQWSEVRPFQTGVGQQLYRVRFSDGSYLDTTAHHRFSVSSKNTRVTKNPWREMTLDEIRLSRGVWATEPFRIDQVDGKQVDAMWAYTLGAIVGDGSVHRKVRASGDTWKGSYESLFGEKDLKMPVVGIRGTSHVANAGNTAIHVTHVFCPKHDPDLVTSFKIDAEALNDVFSWERAAILNFLAGWLDADGTECGRGRVRLYLSREARARKVQLLLTRCGIRSSIGLLGAAGAATNLGVRKQDLWYVDITDCADIPCHRLNTSGGHPPRFKSKFQTIRSIDALPGLHPTFCFEESLRHMGVFGNTLTYQCNLSAAVMRATDTAQTMAEKVRVATWIGVIQSTFTHFPYLREGWANICEEDRLLGVDITGQCDNPRLSMDPGVMTYLNGVARETAAEAAAMMNINMPAAITCGKPSGNCRPWYALTTTDRGLLTMRDLFRRHPMGQEWAPVEAEINVVRPGDVNQRILRTYDNGESRLIRLNTLYGLSVESTPGHRWFVKYRIGSQREIIDVQDWVRAEDIRPNDVLDIKLGTYAQEVHARLSTFNSRAWHMATNAKPIRMPEFLNEELSWFLGYLWGDGSMSPGGFRFRFTDEHDWNLRKVQRILLDQFGLESSLMNPRGRKDFVLEFASVHLWHWLIENGVFKYDAEGGVDIIPIVVRSSARNDIIAFLAGLLDSDGWAGYKRQGLGSVTFTTASALFAQHIQDVAWSVGIGLGRSLNSIGRNFQKKREMYLLGCSSQVNPEAFSVLQQHSNKVQRVAVGERFVDWEWRQAKREYHVGRVLSIVELDPVPTFDIEVATDHWYYAGSVKSHNSSQLVDCASGFHPRYARHYIRRVRIDGKDPLTALLRDSGFPLVRENGMDHIPDHEVPVWVVQFPVKAPDGAMVRDSETALQMCERYLHIMRTWCSERGHNQSATIYVRDDEWEDVGRWVYEHFDEITGLSFLPHDGGQYKLAPYEEITAEEYARLSADMPEIDFSLLSLYEHDDRGKGATELACMSGSCEI